MWFRRFSLAIAGLILISVSGFAQYNFRWRDGQSLQQVATRINQDCARLIGTNEAMEVLSRRLEVPMDTLRDEQRDTNLSLGQIAVAHEIAAAAGLSFEDIASELQEGDSWAQIVSETGVDIRPIRNNLWSTDFALRREYQEHRGYFGHR